MAQIWPDLCLNVPPALVSPLLAQVYDVLKRELSRFVLAVTVDDPASIAAPSPAAETEATNGEAKAEAVGNGGAGTAEGKSATAAADSDAATAAVGEEKDGGTEVGDGDGSAPGGDAAATAAATAETTATTLKRKKPQGSPEESEANEGGAAATSAAKKPKTAADGAAATAAAPAAAEESTDKPKAVENAAVASAGETKRPDPNGPKCVQLKMKRDWRRTDGGGKRRRGDLNRGPGDGRGGGRWGGWPEDRPEFCRFVLYKENGDTVRAAGGGRGCSQEWRRKCEAGGLLGISEGRRKRWEA